MQVHIVTHKLIWRLCKVVTWNVVDDPGLCNALKSCVIHECLFCHLEAHIKQCWSWHLQIWSVIGEWATVELPVIGLLCATAVSTNGCSCGSNCMQCCYTKPCFPTAANASNVSITGTSELPHAHVLQCWKCATFTAANWWYCICCQIFWVRRSVGLLPVRELSL